MSAGLVPADDGSARLTVDRNALIDRWCENFGMDAVYPHEAPLLQQEAEHVAGLVDAAVGAVEKECNAERDVLDGAMHSVWLHGDWRWLTRNMTTKQREVAADAVERYSAALNDGELMSAETLADLRWWRS